MIKKYSCCSDNHINRSLDVFMDTWAREKPKTEHTAVKQKNEEKSSDGTRGRSVEELTCRGAEWRYCGETGGNGEY